MDVKAKRLRREGYVTGNVFGKKIQGSIPVKMEKKDVDRLLKNETKGGQIMLDVEGEVYDVLIKEVDYDAMANQVVEIDFQALVSNEKVHSVAEIIFENHDKVRMELAHKYYALAEVKPDLKVDLFGSDTPEIDLNRIQRVAIFKTRQDGIQCVATIDGQKLQPRSVTPQQWQRMWVAEDRDGYKRHLAATLFADVLQKGQSVGEQKAEEQVRQQNEVVAENRSEETNDENMSPKRQFWDNLKEKHPDALYLIRAGEVYRLYNEDAAKGADILGITMKKYPERGFSAFAEFPRTQLDSYLPKLVRAGERVAISEIELQDKRQDEQETHRGIHR